jgi:hypothetical protein
MEDLKNDDGTATKNNNKVQRETKMDGGDKSTTIEKTENLEDRRREPAEIAEINAIDCDPESLHGEWIRVEQKKNGKKLNKNGFGAILKEENVLSQLTKSDAINGVRNLQNQLQKTIEAFQDGLRQKNKPKLKKKRPRMDLLGVKKHGSSSSKGPDAIIKGNNFTDGGNQPKATQQGDTTKLVKEMNSNVGPNKGRDHQPSTSNTMNTQHYYEGHLKKDGNPIQHNKSNDPNLILGKDHMQIEENHKIIASGDMKSTESRGKNYYGLDP